MSLENDVTLQDWLDIAWQSAIQAKEKGVDVRFVDMGESVGIRIYGVVIRDGRPYLNTTESGESVVFNPSLSPTEATP